MFANHLDRNFDPDAYIPGQALVSDITYLRTGQGWLYLATIIDLATRMVVGWQFADHMRTNLVIDALAMARTHGSIAEDAPVHSDHGTQYTSQEFTDYCAAAGITQSMGRTGVSWDNAVAETFFASLKNEMYHQQVFATRARARMAVALSISKCFTTANDPIPAWSTAPRPKPGPTTKTLPQRYQHTRPNQEENPSDLSKNLDTAQWNVDAPDSWPAHITAAEPLDEIVEIEQE